MAVPVPVRLLGVIEPQVRPDGTVSVRDTVPANPLTDWIVIVELTDEPTTPVGDVAVIVKFWNRNVAAALCVREPLVPVIVSV